MVADAIKPPADNISVSIAKSCALANQRSALFRLGAIVLPDVLPGLQAELRLVLRAVDSDHSPGVVGLQVHLYVHRVLVERTEPNHEAVVGFKECVADIANE